MCEFDPVTKSAKVGIETSGSLDGFAVLSYSTALGHHLVQLVSKVRLVNVEAPHARP
jgi:hypothetical protein